MILHEKINFKSNLMPSESKVRFRANNCRLLWDDISLQFSKEMPTHTRPHQSKYGGKGLKKNNDIIFYSKF